MSIEDRRARANRELGEWADAELVRRFGPAGVAKINEEAHHVYHARQELNEL